MITQLPKSLTFCLLFAFWGAQAQTVIFSHPGASYTNTDAMTTDTYGPADVSNCTSISFSIEYNFSMPYTGPGNMESSSECPFGIPPCQGNPTDPTGGGCDQCWDFFYVQFQVDGVTVNTQLVGVPGNTNQSGTLTYGPICTNGAGTAGFIVQTQTWAADETITFSNLQITCWDGSVADLSVSPANICEGSPFSLTATLTDPGSVASTLWAGPGNIASPTALSTWVNNAPAGASTYTFTATDDNSCTSSGTIEVVVTETPVMDDPPNITVCENDQVDIAFTGNGSYDYSWVNSNTQIGLGSSGNGDISFVAESNPIPHTVGNITVTPSENGCLGVSQTFTISTRPLPIVEQHPDSTYCSGDWIYECPVGTPSEDNGIFWAGAIFTSDNPDVWLIDTLWLALGVCFGAPSAEVQQQEIINITMIPQYADGLCVMDPIYYTVTVNPIIGAPTYPNLEVCAGDQVSAPLGFPDFTWTNTNTAIGLANSGVGDISFTAANVTSITTGTINVMPQGGCYEDPDNFSITVYPKPVANPLTDVEVCPGVMISKLFTGTAGATFTWTNDNPAIGLPPSGSGPINFTSANVTQQQTATITVTPTLGICIGDPVSFTITVNPTPTVDDPGDRVVCVNDFVEVTLSGANSSDYAWTNSNTNIGLDASGTGSFNFIAANVNAPTTGVITITPAGNACPGMSETFQITVSPPPVMTAPNTVVACAGAPVSIPFSGSPGATFQWTNSDTIIGLGAQGSGNVQFQAAWLSSSDTATITVTPLIGTCSGPPVQFQIIIKPAPVLADPANQIVCSGTPVLVPFMGSDSTSFFWINNQTAIGLDSSGTGQISFTADSAGLATITVTPQAFGCVGQSQSFDIQVLPLPALNQPASLQVCAGDSVFVSFTHTLGAIISWTNDNPAIGLGSSGSGNIVFQAPIVTSLTSAQIIATPALGQCTGALQQFEIEIQPLPSLGISTVACAPDMLSYQVELISSGNLLTANAGVISGANGQFVLNDIPADTNVVIISTDTQTGCQTQLAVNAPNCNCAPVSAPVSAVNTVMCAGAPNPALTANTPPGITVDWYSQASGGVLLQSGSNSYTPPDPFSPGVYAFFAEARDSATNCSSPTRLEVTLTVKPVPVVQALPDQAVCAGTTVSVAFSGTPMATMDWTNSLPAIGLDASGTGNFSFLSVNTGNSPAFAQVQVTPQLNGCTGPAQQFILTVNPIPVLTIDSTVCAADLNSYTAFVIAGGDNLQSSLGNVVGTAPMFVVSNIPEGNNALLTTTNTTTGCTQELTLNAPPCACPPLAPPDPVGPTVICAGEPMPVLSVGLQAGMVTDWYSSPSGGVLLLAGSNFYTPSGPLAPGNYTFYAESRSNLSDCTSASRTPVVLTISPAPVMNQPADQTVCAGNQVQVLFSGSTGAAYTWTNNNTGIGLQGNGSGDINFTATANGGTQTAQISVTPQLGACSGPVQVFDVTVHPLPVVNISGNTQVCSGDFTTLSASGNGSLMWSNGQSGSSIQIQPVSSGTYSVTVTNNGCASSQSVAVTVLQPSTLTLQQLSCDPAQVGVTTVTLSNAAGCDSIITTITTLDIPGCTPAPALLAVPVQCFGQNNGVLNIGATGGLAPYQFSWSNGVQNGTGTISTAGSQVQIPNLPAGMYTVTITAANGLTNTMSAEIQSPALLTAQATVQQVFGQQHISCFGATDGQIMASATGGIMPYQFQWSQGSNTPMLSGVGAGLYTVTITDQQQCTVSSSVTLVAPPPLTFGLLFTDTLCSTKQVRSLITPTGGNAPFHVRIDGVLVGMSLNPGLPEGNHLIDITDVYGCVADTTVTITLPPLPVISLPAGVTVSFGETLVLEAQTNLSSWVDLSWNPPGLKACPDCLTQEWTPEATTLYEVWITDALGCTASASALVTVKPEAAIYVPNVFSPDGDGNNDTWNIFVGDPDIQLKNLTIFDRWGEQLYQLDESAPVLSWPGWDGTFRGQPVAPGVYVYYVEMELSNGEKVIKKGDVTVLR